MKKTFNQKKKIGDYCCPDCGADLREVGIMEVSNGWKSDRLSYNEDGTFDDSETIDSDMESERIECGECNVELPYTEDYYEAIPKRIGEDNE